GNHYVGVVECYQTGGIADGVRAGGAGGDDRVVRAFEAKIDGSVTGNEVDQATGDEERRDTPRPLFLQDDGCFADAFETADAGAHQDAGTVAIFLRLRLPAGILHRLFGRGDAEGDEIINPALLLGIEPQIGIERPVGAIAARNLRGDLGRQIAGVEVLDFARAALAFEDARPSFFDAAGERRDHTKASDNDPTHGSSARHSGLRLVDELHSIADRDDGFGSVVRGFDTELFFERHHEFDGVETVRAKVFDERSGLGDLVGIDVQMLDDDLLNALGSIAHWYSNLSLVFVAALFQVYGPKRKASLITGNGALSCLGGNTKHPPAPEFD